MEGSDFWGESSERTESGGSSKRHSDGRRLDFLLAEKKTAR